MDIVVWLRSLGLGKYEAIFRENDIDETVLPSLTHENLKELGVASFGHRVKLLDAIAALRAEGGVEAPSAAAARAEQSATPPSAGSVAQAAGERRYLTVMFCDLVGSTSISAGLDAEEWRDLVGAYLDAASAAVTGLGGHVAKKLGDGLMALFGYPVAQENDTERAARAALSIQRALAEVNRKNAGSGKPVVDKAEAVEVKTERIRRTRNRMATRSHASAVVSGTHICVRFSNRFLSAEGHSAMAGSSRYIRSEVGEIERGCALLRTHPDLSILAQRGRRLLRQAHAPAPQARRWQQYERLVTTRSPKHRPIPRTIPARCRRCSMPARWCSPHRGVPSILRIGVSGGRTCRVPIGGILMVQRAAFMDATLTRSSTSPIRMRSLMRTGRARNCQPKPNGNSPLAAVSTAPNSPGATISRRA